MPLERDAIGVAVDHESELYVIPVASPSAKTVEQISDEIRRNVERLRSGDPQIAANPPGPDDSDESRRLQRRELYPHHQSAGSGRSWASAGSIPTPVAQEDGRIGVEQRCTLTLSVDHRVASGKYAGEFLAAIVQGIGVFLGNGKSDAWTQLERNVQPRRRPIGIRQGFPPRTV